LNGHVRRRKRLATVVLDRIIDTMFADMISGHANHNNNERSDQVERSKERKAVTQNFWNWKTRSMPWSEVVARLGWRMLSLLPEDLSNEK